MVGDFLFFFSFCGSCFFLDRGERILHPADNRRETRAKRGTRKGANDPPAVSAAMLTRALGAAQGRNAKEVELTLGAVVGVVVANAREGSQHGKQPTEEGTRRGNWGPAWLR